MPLSFVFGKFSHVASLCPFAIVFDSLSNFTPSAYKSNITSGFVAGSVAPSPAAQILLAFRLMFSTFGIFVILNPLEASPVTVTLYSFLSSVIKPLSSPTSFTV